MPIVERPAATFDVKKYHGSNRAEIAAFAGQAPGDGPDGALTLDTGDDQPAVLPVGWLVTKRLDGRWAGRIGVISAAHYETWAE